MIAAIVAAAPAAVDPVPPTPPAERSPAAAVAVVRRLYTALDERDYRLAYTLWHGHASYARMTAGYAQTAHVTMTPIPPFEADGGAGSVYCEVKVRVAAVLRNGRRQAFAGAFTLRRINDIDGSNAARRRWHIVGARLTALS